MVLGCRSRAILVAVLAVSIDGYRVAGESFDVLLESRTGGVVEATLCLYSAPLNKEMVVKYLEQFQSVHTGRFGLLRLDMVSGYLCTGKYFADKPRQVTNFQDWLDMVKEARMPDSPVAEVLKSPRGTLLRNRSKEGEVQRFVLDGQDPSIIRKGESIFELVHMRVINPAPIFKDQPGGGRRVEMFFKVSGPLVEADCRSVTDELSKDLNLPFLSTHFRQDPFFIFAERFPIIHPLIPYPELPSEETYKKGIEMGCSIWYERRGCASAFR